MMAGAQASRRNDRQRGAALLAILALVMVVGVGLFFRQLSNADIVAARDRTTQTALRDAREALIAYAATSDTPGRLPCPEDTSLVGGPSEGAQGSCSNTVMAIGRLPWRTLKLEQLRDGWDEPLWYAISPGFRSPPINTNSIGQLSVGTLGYAAIIFSAGPPLAGQNRSVVTAVAPPVIANYLDGENANGNMVFAAAGANINDRLTGITVAELTAPIVRRALAEIRGPTDASFGLRRYYSENGSTFPYADNTGDGNADVGVTSGTIPYLTLEPLLAATTYGWLNNNGWFALTSYQSLTAPNQAIVSIGATTLTAPP